MRENCSARHPGGGLVETGFGLGGGISWIGKCDRRKLQVAKWKVEGLRGRNRFWYLRREVRASSSGGRKNSLLVRPRAAAGESNKIQGRVADVLFQQDGFKVRLDNGLYFYLKDEPKIGQKIEIKIKLECLE